MPLSPKWGCEVPWRVIKPTQHLYITSLQSNNIYIYMYTYYISVISKVVNVVRYPIFQ